MTRKQLESTGSRDPQVRAQERRSASLFRGVANRVASLEGGVLSGAVRIVGVELTATPADFAHGLGRAPVGAFITAGAVAGETLVWSDGASPARNISLALSSGSATVDVVVF